jgi:hypothetical protein
VGAIPSGNTPEQFLHIINAEHRIGLGGENSGAKVDGALLAAQCKAPLLGAFQSTQQCSSVQQRMGGFKQTTSWPAWILAQHVDEAD